MVNVGVQQGIIALICLLFVSWALNTILIWERLQCTQEGVLIIFNRSSKGMRGRLLTFAWIVRRNPRSCHMTHYQSTVALVASSFKQTLWQKNHNTTENCSSHNGPISLPYILILVSTLEIETNRLTKLYYCRREWESGPTRWKAGEYGVSNYR